MKKTKLLAIPLLAALMFTGCSAANETANKAPSVVGVKDIQCMVNSTVDFLDGVAALDYEDGDITPDLKITVTPDVQVKDGYALFTEVGEYTVNYQVEDSNGRVATKRAYVDVVDREMYKTFSMPEGFSAEASGTATLENCGLENGLFKLDIKGGEIAEDVKLSRTFTISTGIAYTFRYRINSDVAGKIKVMADGKDCAELAVSAGDNVLTFTHTALKIDANDQRDVKIDICLGSLGQAKWVVNGVEYEYPQEEGKLVERAENFNFTGRVESRIDVKLNDQEGTDSGLRGNAWSDDGGNVAKLEITEVGENKSIWLGGMFVNTGIALKAGVTYKISMDTACKPLDDREAGTENDYEIVFKYKQWGPNEDISEATIRKPVDGTVTAELNITESTAGSLWIYVQSGTQKNEITISNLSVKEVLNAKGKDTFAIEDFGCSGGQLKTSGGNFTFDVETFSADGGATAVTSPSFFVAGSGANYVLTFRAKASAPVEMVVAIPVTGGWDPTILWSRINLSQEETLYTFICNANDADRLHTIAWQFGSAANQQYNNVKIEISDIKISLKNGELDN